MATATRTATSNTNDATRRPASKTSAGRIPGTRSRSHDGTLAPTPRATCEIQGYVYDAKRRTARLARDVWGDPEWAEQARARGRRSQDAVQQRLLGRRTRLLRARARRQETSGRFADLQHRPPAVERDRGRRQGGELRQAPDGRGAVHGLGGPHDGGGEGSYNPIGYHVGTVWPHDSSFIAWGLRRYGYAPRPAASASASWRPPTSSTAACPRRSAATRASVTHYPVEYPTACSPQAWATGAPLLILRDAARARLGRRAHDRRSRHTRAAGAHRAARHPRALGANGRLRRGRKMTQDH